MAFATTLVTAPPGTGTVTERSRVVKADLNGVSVERVFELVPYDDIRFLVLKLLGAPRIVSGVLQRTPPHADPWLPKCFCTDLEITGLAPFGIVPFEHPLTPSGYTVLDATNTYQSALVKATYRTLPWDPTAVYEVDALEITQDTSSQLITIPDDFFTFPSNGVLLGVSQGTPATVTEARSTILATRHFVAYAPLLAIGTMENRINKSDYALRDTSYAAETLRFDGSKTMSRTSVDGVLWYDVVYSFSRVALVDKIETGTVAVVGWNRAFNPKKGWWEKPKSVPGNRTLYLYDEDVPVQSGAPGVLGFDQLFDPRTQ